MSSSILQRSLAGKVYILLDDTTLSIENFEPVMIELQEMNTVVQTIPKVKELYLKLNNISQLSAKSTCFFSVKWLKS